MALMAERTCETSLRAVALDRELVTALGGACPLVRDDAVAHGREWAFSSKVHQDLGQGCALPVQPSSCVAVIVAGTDITRCGRHYRHCLAAGMTAQAFAYQEDQYASDLMLALDPQELS